MSRILSRVAPVKLTYHLWEEKPWFDQGIINTTECISFLKGTHKLFYTNNLLANVRFSGPGWIIEGHVLGYNMVRYDKGWLDAIIVTHISISTPMV